jgi:taurine dioxygenase
MRIEPMPGPFGATVSGVDTASPVASEVIESLWQALYEHHILLLTGQHFDAPAYSAFGRQWGDPIMFFNPADRDPELPELIQIRNDANTPPERRDGAMHWHQDSTYETVPAAITMLAAVEAPAGANATLFADAVAAYETLESATKRRIDGLRVVHSPGGGAPELAFHGEYRGRGKRDEGRVWREVTHPLVWRHPDTGRPALHGISGTAVGIEGMPRDDAIALLIELKSHVTHDEFVQTATANVGTILIWDNFAVLHRATATKYSDTDGERRRIYRYSTRTIRPSRTARSASVRAGT